MFKLAIAHLFLGLCLALTPLQANAGVLFEFTNLQNLGGDDWSIDVVGSSVGNSAPPGLLGLVMVAEFNGISGRFSNDVVPASNGIGTLADVTPGDQVDLGPTQVHGIWFFRDENRSYDNKTLFSFRFTTTETPVLTSIKAAYPNDPSFLPSYSFFPGRQAPGELIEFGEPQIGYRSSQTVPEPLSFCVFLAPAVVLFRRARRSAK